MKPRVSIIILNWNQPEFTVNCVKSVLKQSYPDYEILLVDNGSKDNSIEIFNQEFSENKKIKIVENSENLGYAGGNNEGVKRAKGEYVIILNNDTLVEENWLSELVEGMESSPEVGAVSSNEIKVGAKFITNWRTEDVTRTLGWYKAKFKRPKTLKGDFAPIVHIKGCSFIYKKNLVELPFDPEYFIYAEDDYLAWLLNLKGYENKIAINSVVRHFHNVVRKSSKGVNKYFVFLGERNRLMNLLIFYELPTLLRIIPLVLTNVLLLNLIELRGLPSRLKAYLWLLTHPGKILKKRKSIQRQRKIHDKELIKKLSCKIRDETFFEDSTKRKILTIINKIAYLYSMIVGLRTRETS